MNQAHVYSSCDPEKRLKVERLLTFERNKLLCINFNEQHLNVTNAANQKSKNPSLCLCYKLFSRAGTELLKRSSIQLVYRLAARSSGLTEGWLCTAAMSSAAPMLAAKAISSHTLSEGEKVRVNGCSLQTEHLCTQTNTHPYTQGISSTGVMCVFNKLLLVRGNDCRNSAALHLLL